MNTENEVKVAVWFFVIILAGSLLSALLGGGFGAIVAAVSPELVNGFFSPDTGESIMRTLSPSA